MARYTGPSCKLCMRENLKLYLKGERCYKDKCRIEKNAKKSNDKKNFAPGQHGKNQNKLSVYGEQFREKQKVKRLYGVLEAQFHRYFVMANKGGGITGEALMQILERRLDNVVYRAGFAGSRKEARQFVRHNHVTVDGRKVNIPSFSVKAGQVVRIAEGSREVTRIVESIDTADGRGIPEWITVNKQAFEATVNRLPERDDVNYEIHESLIVELYSK